LLVSKTVILVTGVFIPKTIFKINFLCVLFFRLMIFFWIRSCQPLVYALIYLGVQCVENIDLGFIRRRKFL
jgi:hypothetical protein